VPHTPEPAPGILSQPQAPAEPPSLERTEAVRYLPETRFDPEDEGSYYVVEIDDAGLVVYSECCLDRMCLSTARLVHEALGRWLADQPGGTA
jgi:hypothetical protein